jgi:hypothetical protein
VVSELELIREELAAYERDAEELQEDAAALHDEVEHERAGSEDARVLKELRGEVAMAAAEAADLEKAIADLRGAQSPSA